MTLTKAWNYTINASIMLTTAVLLLPINLWPPAVTKWFVELNTAILMLWTLEFILKTISFGFTEYFTSFDINSPSLPSIFSVFRL